MTRGSWWMLVLTLTQVMTGCTPPQSQETDLVDDEGNPYVADYANFRVQKFTPKVNADPSRLIGPRYVSGTPTSQG